MNKSRFTEHRIVVILSARPPTTTSGKRSTAASTLKRMRETKHEPPSLIGTLTPGDALNHVLHTVFQQRSLPKWVYF